MAAGKESDFKIYHSEFYGGMYERLVQVTQTFNIASSGSRSSSVISSSSTPSEP